MLTWTKNGEWGLNGMDIKDVPNNLYGAICKLHNYERLGLEPEEIEMLDELYLEKCKEVTALKEELKAYGAGDRKQMGYREFQRHTQLGGNTDG